MIFQMAIIPGDSEMFAHEVGGAHGDDEQGRGRIEIGKESMCDGAERSIAADDDGGYRVGGDGVGWNVGGVF